jgi:HEPN domain-containing protein
MNSTPFSNDIKLHDSIGNIKTDPTELAKSALRNAREFMDVSRLAMLSTKVTPAYVNLGFSCELILKSLLYYFKIDFQRTHKLYKLFCLLPVKIQTEIKESVIDRFERYNMFEQVFEELNDSFQFARYAHERKSVVFGVGDLAIIVAYAYEIANKYINVSTEADNE